MKTVYGDHGAMFQILVRLGTHGMKVQKPLTRTVILRWPIQLVGIESN